MRHILVHGYYLIDSKFISYTIKENLIPLKLQITTYLAEFNNS